MKWICWPSIVVRKCGQRLKRSSCARQSNFVLPRLAQVLEVGEVGAVAPAAVRDLVGPARAGEPLAQVVEHSLGHVDTKRRDLFGSHARDAIPSVDSPAMALDAIDPLHAFRLDGKVAIVTGASAGLGARFARVLDAAGARVVVSARRADRLDRLVAELHDAHPVVCDLAEDGAPEALVAAALAHYGRIDVLVNNAGMSDPTPALDESTAHFVARCA